MPMSDIAFAAGFASIRQFNDTVREVFAVSPTTMRTEAQRASRSGDNQVVPTNGSLTLRLPYREPLDRGWLEWFLSSHVAPGMELWEDRAYTRNVRTPHGHATTRLSFQRDHVLAELALNDMRDLAPTVARLRHLLDLDADPVGIDEALGVVPAATEAATARRQNGSGAKPLGDADAEPSPDAADQFPDVGAAPAQHPFNVGVTPRSGNRSRCPRPPPIPRDWSRRSANGSTDRYRCCSRPRRQSPNAARRC
jgi:AraC family transcriptional regulator of adaptative response / DNA-3-methyladenine glycosylase II